MWVSDSVVTCWTWADRYSSGSGNCQEGSVSERLCSHLELSTDRWSPGSGNWGGQCKWQCSHLELSTDRWSPGSGNCKEGSVGMLQCSHLLDLRTPRYSPGSGNCQKGSVGSESEVVCWTWEHPGGSENFVEVSVVKWQRIHLLELSTTRCSPRSENLVGQWGNWQYGHLDQSTDRCSPWSGNWGG